MKHVNGAPLEAEVEAASDGEPFLYSFIYLLSMGLM